MDALPPMHDRYIAHKALAFGVGGREEAVRGVSAPRAMTTRYEAGPTGYELYRLLVSLGVRCEVVAPSRVPKGKATR
jgi:hypothetical protein